MVDTGDNMVGFEQQMDSREPAEQVAGRLIGMVVFLAGIAMIAVVFVLAYLAFGNPEQIIPLQKLHQTPPAAPIVILAPALLRLVLLFAMGYLGSLIAARGAQMFFSARREVRRVVHRD